MEVTMPGSVVQVAEGGKLLGALVVADRIKPQSPEAIQELRRLGIQNIAMLTGDKRTGPSPWPSA